MRRTTLAALAAAALLLAAAPAEGRKPAPTPTPTPAPSGPQVYDVPGDCATIQACVDLARAGDTVVVHGPAVYHEAVASRASGVRILGQGAPVIDADGAPVAVTLTHSNIGLETILVRDAGVGVVGAGDGLFMYGVSVSATSGSGFELRGASGWIVRNTASGAGGSGFVVTGSYLTGYDNESHGNAGWGYEIGGVQNRFDSSNQGSDNGLGLCTGACP